MPSTTIHEFKFYMNLTKVDYQISPYHHSADPAQPTISKCSSFETNQYNPPHISVSADRGQSPLSVCTEDFVSYEMSSSCNLNLHTEVCIVFCQTFLVVLQYGGFCKNMPFMLIPTVGL